MCFFFYSLLVVVADSPLFIHTKILCCIHSSIQSRPRKTFIIIYLFSFFFLFVATIQRWKRVPYIHKCIQHTTHSVRATDDSCVALSPNSTNKNNNKIHSHPFISLLHFFFYPIILFVSAIFILGYFFFLFSARHRHCS